MPSNPFIELTGPLLMGGLFSYFLDGVFAMQLYHYYINYAGTDRRSIRYLVALSAVMEILFIVMVTHAVYTSLAAGYANPAVLVTSPFSVASLPFINGFTGVILQLFFAWRIQVLNQSLFSKVAAVAVALTALMQGASALGVTIQLSLLKDYAGMQTKAFTSNTTTWLVTSVVCDLLITVSMVLLLRKARSSTVYTSSKSLLDGLIVHTIENGLITTTFAIVVLITFHLLPGTFYFVSFGYILGRLYSNVLLATLNGRQRRRETYMKDDNFSKSFPSTGLQTISALKFGSSTTDSHGVPLDRITKPGTIVSVGTLTEVHVSKEHDESRDDSKAYS